MLLVVGALLAAASSFAHGFGAHGACLVADAPTAYAVAFPKGADAEVVAMTNFGLLRSEDGGESYRWGCVESYALASGDGWLDGAPKTLSVLDDGTLYVLYTIGYWESRDGGCGYRFAPDPALMSASVVWVTSSPAAPSVAFAVASAPGQPPFGVFRSDDGGASFSATAVAIYDFGVPVTSLVTSADGLVLYALSLSFEGMPLLWRSVNGGASFTAFPLALPVEDAVLLGVDPAAPETLYLEVTDEPSGPCSFRTRILRSDDGGASFQAVHERTGDVLTGARVRDDGSLWLAWRDAGLERIGPTGEVSLRVALPLSCLAESEDGLVVCPFGGEPHLALAYDDESGALSPFLTREDVSGPLACAPGTRGADVCAPKWEAAAEALALGPRVLDGGPPDGGPPDGGPPDAGPPDAGSLDGGPDDGGAPGGGGDAGAPGQDAGSGDPQDAGPREEPALDLLAEPRPPRGLEGGCQATGAPLLVGLLPALLLLTRRRRARRLGGAR